MLGDDRCRLMGELNLQIHHVDGDSGNDQPRNLVPLCKLHHRELAGSPRSAFWEPPAWVITPGGGARIVE
jgi:hypothetical protein